MGRMSAQPTTIPFDYYDFDRQVAHDFSLTPPRDGGYYALRCHARPGRDLFDAPPRDLWHYRRLLPVLDDACVTSLGEGATPLVAAPRLAAHHAIGEILCKYEGANPTGSFKDRQISVAISHAREIGADTIAVVSSGNVACATAAYAARAGMRAVCLMHGMAGGWKTKQAAAYGASVLRVDTPSAAAVFELCIAACEQYGWYHGSTAGMYEPFNVEGAKTIAYELFHQTGGNLPDWIVAPVGGGGLLGGIWRGLLDLQRLGFIERMPRLAGVQASGCAPLQQALEQGWTFEQSLQHPWPDPYSIAGGIADDILFDGHTALPAIRETNGAALSVTDEEIIAAELRLAQSEGFLVEPSCAVVVAALKHLPDAGPDTRVCCILTGTGIKDLPVLDGHVPAPRAVEGNVEAIRKAVEER